MKKLAIIFLFFFTSFFYGQEVVSTGIKRTIKSIENDDLPQIITVKKLGNSKKKEVVKDSSKVIKGIKRTVNTVTTTTSEKNKHHLSIKRVVN